MIQKHVLHGRMLDIGCSIGAFFEFFPKPDWETYGVEFSPSAAAYAAKTYGSHVHVGTLLSASYPDKYFDLITLIDTLYYIDDPVAELCEVRRVLKPQGLLAVEIAGQSYALWRNYGIVPRVLDKRWSRADSDSSYIFWFNPTSLSRLLEKCGLQVIDWYIVASPRRSSRMLNFMANAHYQTMQVLTKLSPKLLTWAPKYVCLATSKGI